MRDDDNGDVSEVFVLFVFALCSSYRCIKILRCEQVKSVRAREVAEPILGVAERW